MGLEAVGPKPRLSWPHPAKRVYPYLLRDLAIERVNQVWSTDITYIRLRPGFVYLVAALDWFSATCWRGSCRSPSTGSYTLARALATKRPTIFNTDQGSQFTSATFTGLFRTAGVQISMDGRDRTLDHVFVERLWRSVNYEEVYLKDYTSVTDARVQLGRYFTFYDQEPPHLGVGLSHARGGVRPGPGRVAAVRPGAETTNTDCGNVESSHKTRRSHIPTAIIQIHTHEDDLNLSGPENCLDNRVHLMLRAPVQQPSLKEASQRSHSFHSVSP